MKRTRGERAGLSRQKVLDAALVLVDREGIDKLSMRRLGTVLGVEAMTLYHYVPNKDALLAGLVERVLTLVPIDLGLPWRQALRNYAHALRQALLRHPRMLPLCFTRSATSPDSLRATETGLNLLVTQGFPLSQALNLLNSLHLFVLAHATSEVGIQLNNGAPGSAAWLSDLDPQQFPLLTTAARTGAGVDDTARFTAAVDALLNGFTESK